MGGAPTPKRYSHLSPRIGSTSISAWGFAFVTKHHHFPEQLGKGCEDLAVENCAMHVCFVVFIVYSFSIISIIISIIIIIVIIIISIIIINIVCSIIIYVAVIVIITIMYCD